MSREGQGAHSNVLAGIAKKSREKGRRRWLVAQAKHDGSANGHALFKVSFSDCQWDKA